MQIVLIPNNVPFKKNIVEPGRNSPCHCKSGRKYKHCCLDKNYAVVRAKVLEASKQNVESAKPLPEQATTPEPTHGEVKKKWFWE